jgi:hypothetical protein
MASTFFTRLLQPTKEVPLAVQPDDIEAFDTSWRAIQVSDSSGPLLNILLMR